MKRRSDRLQTYADAHCDGDRSLAMYEILFGAGQGAMDPYVDEMDKEDATFTFSMMRLHAVRCYGSEENYQKALKAEQLAAQLRVSTDDVRQGRGKPSAKGLLGKFLLLMGAILLPIFGTLLLKNMNMGADLLMAVQPVLIALASMGVAGELLARPKYRKLKKLLEEVPEPAKDMEYPSFEECQAHYAATMRGSKEYPATCADKAKEVMDAARTVNVTALLMLPVYAVVIFIALLSARMSGAVAGILGCVAIVAFFFWQMGRVWKAAIQTRDVTNGIPSQDAGKKSAEHRQQFYGLGVILIGGIYVLAAVVGCILCIAMISA